MILRGLKKKETDEIINFLKERFDFPTNVLNEFELMVNPKGKVFLVNPYVAQFAREYTLTTTSLPFARLGKHVKPTSMMIQMFGMHARRNILNVNKENAKKFMEGEDIKVNNHSCENGYVIISYKGHALGCGLLSKGYIKNMIPKAKRMVVEFL